MFPAFYRPEVTCDCVSRLLALRGSVYEGHCYRQCVSDRDEMCRPRSIIDELESIRKESSHRHWVWWVTCEREHGDIRRWCGNDFGRYINSRARLESGSGRS